MYCPGNTANLDCFDINKYKGLRLFIRIYLVLVMTNELNFKSIGKRSNVEEENQLEHVETLSDSEQAIKRSDD
jgi:hypothetical protein